MPTVLFCSLATITFLFSIQGGLSPVCVACCKGHTDVVDLLVKAGADIHLASTEVWANTRFASKAA